MANIHNCGNLPVPCRDVLTSTDLKYALPAYFYFNPVFKNQEYTLEKQSDTSHKAILKNSFGVIQKGSSYEAYTDGEADIIADGIKIRLSTTEARDLIVVSLTKTNPNETYKLCRGFTFQVPEFTDTFNVGEAGVQSLVSLNEPTMIFNGGSMYVPLKDKVIQRGKMIVAFANPLRAYVDYVYLSRGYSKGQLYFEGMFLSDQYSIHTNKFATVINIETNEIYNCSVTCDDLKYKYSKFIKVKFNVL